MGAVIRHPLCSLEGGSLLGTSDERSGNIVFVFCLASLLLRYTESR